MIGSRRYPKTPIPSVAAVVVSSRGILLKRRSKPPFEGFWNILSGVIEVGESQEEAIVREVREEAGVDCQIIRFLDTFDLIITDPEGRVEYHFVVNVYLLQASTDKTHNNDKTVNIRWFHPGSMPVDEMPEPVSSALKRIDAQLLKLM